MKKILLDSSFIIAIFRRKDPLHQRAIENKELLENDCHVSNGIISEVITILSQKTKDITLVRLAYNYMKDNFTIIDESEINMYNDNVFAIFEKYNKNKFKLGFIDCSQVVIYEHYNLDYLVSFDEEFNLFEEVKLLELK
ncbi:PIN domain-containing protein [Methanobrevibacter olleyae]|uniref:PIN domain-containing protein n=1 Tax=Methanobrevibacter olleyae TaxID=294671 RepID=A0A126QYK0_METOL|nr:PIN domain-containing protein [Methanobrevibacter olleyae]AMK15220.1 PIN domain-containing protein [Methanobrevibacter olleyae]SFL71463.1 Predicted nucleic acid-binding protein, contains PIN domain [Methanobrevibacter olleyae]